MSQRWFDFLSSFGIMAGGVILLGVGSVTLTARPVQNFVAQLPTSRLRPAVVGGDVTPAALPVSRPRLPMVKDNATYEHAGTASAVLVVDDKTNTVLFKKHSDEVRPLASVTKLMSALVLSELPIQWSSTTLIAQEDSDGSSHQVAIGEEFALDDLWEIALVGSSNSAIEALVRNSGLTNEAFVARMNEKAKELNFFSMHFVEPTGLDKQNVAHALDASRLLKEALQVEKIYTALQTPGVAVKPVNKEKRRQVWSTNWLLTKWVPNNYEPERIVGKTGYIEDSGYNVVVRFTDKKQRGIRVVILGAASNEARFMEAKDVADWVFAHYVWPEEEGYEEMINE